MASGLPPHPAAGRLHRAHPSGYRRHRSSCHLRLNSKGRQVYRCFQRLLLKLHNNKIRGKEQSPHPRQAVPVPRRDFDIPV